MNEPHGASYWIQQLGLTPHPEGGFFAEVYRSTESVPHAALPKRFAGDRAFCTSIFYLLRRGEYSTFHRICSDETWHFYAGDALEVLMLEPGRVRTVRIGRNIHLGECLQYTVPAGVWFAARPADGTSFCLVGCTVSPGFDFADLEMANRLELRDAFPESALTINELTRE